MRFFIAITILLSSHTVFAAPPAALQENQTREFVMSCTYGAMAGTLVGAASLAFTSKPSENLSRVARGASIGLYAGILLGLYVVYILPSLEEGAGEEDPGARLDRIPFMVSPIFSADRLSKLDGAKADWTVMRF